MTSPTVLIEAISVTGKFKHPRLNLQYHDVAKILFLGLCKTRKSDRC